MIFKSSLRSIGITFAALLMTFYDTICDAFEDKDWFQLTRELSSADDQGKFLTELFSGAMRDWKIYPGHSLCPEFPQLPLRFDSIYGSGTYAVVLRAVDRKGDIYAFKIVGNDEFVEADTQLHSYLAGEGLAPKLYMSRRIDNLLCVVMDPIKEVLCNAKRPIHMGLFMEFLRRKRSVGLVHGDMHLDNIVVLQNGDYGLIDFDFAFISPALHPIDFIPLIGSLVRRKEPVFKTFMDHILSYCEREHNMQFDKVFTSRKGVGYYYCGLSSYARHNGVQALNKVFPNIRL